jgi:histidyl-tRNA synthetase
MPAKKKTKRAPTHSSHKASKGTTKRSKKIDNSLIISKYYGFKTLDIKGIEKGHHEKAKKIKCKEDFKHDHLPYLEEYVSLLSYVHTEYTKPLPALFYTKGEIKTSRQKKTPSQNVGLHIIGTDKSIAEAILIKTAFAILQEEGYKNLVVGINSLGGKDSQGNFNKALTNYFKGKLDDLDANCKKLLKFGGHTLMACKPKKISQLLDETPSSIEFLAELERRHFKEVIEYLESQDIPFEIDKEVVGDPHYSSGTVFTISDKKTNKVLATGTRYDDLARRTVYRKGLPAVSLNITLPKLKKVTQRKEPRFDLCDTYFIQLGYAAKLKSLEVIEVLRKAGIPVYHAIGRDKMSTQTSFANNKDAKYILLLGQKEALENSVCVRDQESNSQLTVPLVNLVEHLKKLRKKNKN